VPELVDYDDLLPCAGLNHSLSLGNLGKISLASFFMISANVKKKFSPSLKRHYDRTCTSKTFRNNFYRTKHTGQSVYRTKFVLKTCTGQTYLTYRTKRTLYTGQLLAT